MARKYRNGPTDQKHLERAVLALRRRFSRTFADPLSSAIASNKKCPPDARLIGACRLQGLAGHAIYLAYRKL